MKTQAIVLAAMLATVNYNTWTLAPQDSWSCNSGWYRIYDRKKKRK